MHCLVGVSGVSFVSLSQGNSLLASLNLSNMDISVGGNIAARPKMLMCYLCGREYGTKSLPIHIPQCQKKWLAEQELKPPKERRPLPLPPVELPIATSSGGYNVDAFNDAAYAQWEGTLEQCTHCERKFRPEAFKHHQKSCTALRPAKKAGTGLTAASLSNRLPPGIISGTTRGEKQVPEASASTLKVEVKIDGGGATSSSSAKVRQKWSLLPKHSDGDYKEEKCDKCESPFVRPEAKFCSECGAKRNL